MKGKSITTKDKLLTKGELDSRLKKCIKIMDEFFPEEFVRTALFVYQLDVDNEDVYTSAISSLESEQLLYLLRGFLNGEEGITDEVVNKPLLN